MSTQSKDQHQNQGAAPPGDQAASTGETTATRAPSASLTRALMTPDPSDPRWTQVVKLAELGVMTASVLHELRQPLFALKGYLQLLHHEAKTEGRLNTKLSRSLGLVEEIEAMAGGLLDFSRTPGETLLPLDLRDILDAACTLLRNRIRRANVTLELRIQEPLPGIRGNPGTLSQVLVNLLVNAVDALLMLQPDQPRYLWVIARTQPEQARVEVLVADSGVGISPEHRAHLFDWFFTTKAPGKGTGLGLAIAQEITHAHGGTLTLLDDAATTVREGLAAPGPWRIQLDAPKSQAQEPPPSAATAFLLTFSTLPSR